MTQDDRSTWTTPQHPPGRKPTWWIIASIVAVLVLVGGAYATYTAYIDQQRADVEALPERPGEYPITQDVGKCQPGVLAVVRRMIPKAGREESPTHCAFRSPLGGTRPQLLLVSSQTWPATGSGVSAQAGNRVRERERETLAEKPGVKAYHRRLSGVGDEAFIVYRRESKVRTARLVFRRANLVGELNLTDYLGVSRADDPPARRLRENAVNGVTEIAKAVVRGLPKPQGG